MYKLITDLTNPTAPSMVGDPEYGDASCDNIWRSETYQDQYESWVSGGEYDSTKMMMRTADVKGNWLEKEHHECLPDFSCCQPELAWEVDVRKSFDVASPEDRHMFLSRSLSALANMESLTFVAGQKEPNH